MRRLNALLLLGLPFAFACGATTEPTEPEEEAEILQYETESGPGDLASLDARFAADLSYGDLALQDFDIFMPNGVESAPLAIYVHGGGFTQGDKDNYWGWFEGVTTELIESGVAVASINYRLLEDVDSEGVLKPLSDCARALQYIRWYHESFNIDPDRIAVYGTSAGAGAALWLATHDEMAQADSEDPIARQSTRIAGAAALETQATYDIVRWEEIFDEYGITIQGMAMLGFEQLILSFLGLDSMDQIDSQEGIAYRQNIDMLALMSSDDPAIWVSNEGDVTFPADLGVLYHHPYHAEAVMEAAQDAGVSVSATIPALEIDDGEDMAGFLLGVLGD